MRFIIVVVAALVGCGSKQPAPQREQPPISNTKPVQDPPTKTASDCACAACTTPELWTLMCEYTDQVCACKDLDCITRAGEEFAKKAEKYAKDTDAKREMSAAETAHAERITARLATCTKKIADEMTKQVDAP